MELGADRTVVGRMKPYLLMVLMQFGFAGIHIITVATLRQGTSHYVLVVYRNIVAVAVMAPFALWFERKTRPKMTLLVFFKIMAMALLEIVFDQNLYYMGTKLTSASFAAALIKIPAVTFVMALVFRMEKVNIKERHSQAKIVGNLVTVAGALVMIFYKGSIIEFPWTKGQHHHIITVSHSGSEWLEGTFFLLASSFFCSGFVILQANTLVSYPTELSLTTLICLVGVVMSIVVALVAERGNPKSWSIGWDTRLFAAVYSGVVCTGVAYYVQGIVIKDRGPVFVTAFNPLCMIIVAFLGSIILSEVIDLGMMLGAVIIVIGLYFFIWGKSKEHKVIEQES